jgi:hypothetical protein
MNMDSSYSFSDTEPVVESDVTAEKMPTLEHLAKLYVVEEGADSYSLRSVMSKKDYTFVLTWPSLRLLFFALLRHCHLDKFARDPESFQILWMACADSAKHDEDEFCQLSQQFVNNFDTAVTLLFIGDSVRDGPDFKKSIAEQFPRLVELYKAKYPTGYQG